MQEPVSAGEDGLATMSARTLSPPNKGWGRKGEDTPQSKLRDADVIAARLEYAGGVTPQAIADRLGVTITTVYKMLAGRTWGHLPGALVMRGRRGGAR